MRQLAGRIRPILLCLAMLLTVALLLSSCGYRSLPRPEAGKDGSNKFRIYVPQWSNRTNELGLESTLNNALCSWFTESGHFEVIQQRENADYILTGEIISSQHPGASYGAFDQATALKSVLSVSYSLTSAASGAVLLKDPLYTGEGTYLLGSDAVRTLSLRKQNLASMADEIGEEVYIRLLIVLTSPNGKQPE
jgi:hypothetical protein